MSEYLVVLGINMCRQSVVVFIVLLIANLSTSFNFKRKYIGRSLLLV